MYNHKRHADKSVLLYDTLFQEVCLCSWDISANSKW